jgi:N-acetylglutamate synthase-like GNAT family acetyltransferase
VGPGGLTGQAADNAGFAAPDRGRREAMTCEIRPARPADAARLTAIAFAAKRHWGYPESWIQRWRVSLTISPEYIAANTCFVALRLGEIIGFSALRFDAERMPWVDHVWVLPSTIGSGIGRQLFAACEAEARRTGATRLRVEADPNAEGFYRRMGARTIERRPAAMDGTERFLPIMEKVFADAKT